MKLKEILKTGVIVGSLSVGGLWLGGCSSSPSFDWKAYVNNFQADVAEIGCRASCIDSNSVENCRDKKPAIYGFGGWGKNRIDEIINPLVSRIEVSDYAGPALGHWPRVMERIKEQYKAGNPIILIGHSAGCRDVVEVANILEKAEVPVGAIFLDATHLGSGLFTPGVKGIADSSLISGNVYQIENYVARGSFKGRKLTDADFKNKNAACSKYTNIPIETGHLGLLKEGFSDKYARSIGRILEECSKREQGYNGEKREQEEDIELDKDWERDKGEEQDKDMGQSKEEVRDNWHDIIIKLGEDFLVF